MAISCRHWNAIHFNQVKTVPRDNEVVCNSAGSVHGINQSSARLKQKPQPTTDRFNEKMLKLGYDAIQHYYQSVTGVRCWRDVVFMAQ